ncbi:MAG: ATP-binding protein [Oscillatoria sp. SIO1A7]|nr:ATP-binding protein [Oscillatoria sp. SIO1A7]
MTLIDPLYNTDNPALLGDRTEEIDDLNQTPLKKIGSIDEDLTVSYSLASAGDREVLYNDLSGLITIPYGVESIIEIRPIADDSETDLLTGEPIVLLETADYAIAGLTEVNGDPLLDNDSISYSVESGEGDSHQGNIDLTESPPELNLNNSNTNDGLLGVAPDAEFASLSLSGNSKPDLINDIILDYNPENGENDSYKVNFTESPESNPNSPNKNDDDLDIAPQDGEIYSNFIGTDISSGEIEFTYSSEDLNPDTPDRNAPNNVSLEAHTENGESGSNSTGKEGEPSWKYSIYYYIPTINVDLSDLRQEPNPDSTNKNDANLEANPHNPQHGGGASDSRAKLAEPIWEYKIPFSTSQINIDLTDLWKEPNPNLDINPQNGERYSDLLGNYISYGEIDSSGFLDSGLEKSDSEIKLILNRAIENIKTAVADKNLHDRRLALIPIAKELNSLLLDSPPTSDRESIFSQKPEDFAQNIGMAASALAEAEFNREIQSPHIIGPPLAYSEETFIARTGISSQIEQTTLDRRRRPLLLYGQRRMGKTSLLNNLGRLLPDNIIPLFVDLQGPATTAKNNTGFLYNIARGMVKSAQTQSDLTLPQLTRQTLAADPFTVFDEWLDRVEETMGEKTALLALDEFEALEGAIAKKRFDPAEVLGMLRNLIQHRPRFKVLLAGSHTIEEFQTWASYLINVQVVKIGYLKESEARQLVEQPVKDFALQYEPDAVERILYLTRCHPFLVQLLCEEIVAFKNEQNPASRPLATVADVEAAVPAALSSGSFFFADIKTNQISCLGSEVLQFMAARGESAITDRSALSRQFPCKLDSTLDNLLRRELIEEADNGGYRFQVESIRRSFV